MCECVCMYYVRAAEHTVFHQLTEWGQCKRLFSEAYWLFSNPLIGWMKQLIVNYCWTIIKSKQEQRAIIIQRLFAIQFDFIMFFFSTFYLTILFVSRYKSIFVCSIEFSKTVPDGMPFYVCAITSTCYNLNFVNFEKIDE